MPCLRPLKEEHKVKGTYFNRLEKSDPVTAGRDM